MPKQKIEVEIGAKPKSKVKAGTAPKTHPIPEGGKAKGDVTGQELEYRLMRCWNCQGLSYIWYDTDAYHNYECCYCGAINTL